MSQLLFFLFGLMLGGFLATIFLCCLQLGRINAYEAQIRRLTEQKK